MSGHLEWWNAGILEYWNTGILEYWNIGILNLKETLKWQRRLAAEPEPRRPMPLTFHVGIRVDGQLVDRYEWLQNKHIRATFLRLSAASPSILIQLRKLEGETLASRRLS